MVKYILWRRRNGESSWKGLGDPMKVDLDQLGKRSVGLVMQKEEVEV